MKTIDDYIQDFWGKINDDLTDNRGRFIPAWDIKYVMREIQKDAYNQAIKDAAENAEILFPEYLDGNNLIYKCAIEDIVVDQDSILKLLK